MTPETESRTEGTFGNRHRSRELALQTLYACEVGASPEWQTMLHQIADESALPPDVVKYARDLLTIVYASITMIDTRITACAANWDIKRMAAIDRNIIRLAIAELGATPIVPAKVVIDEAVELAKAFGTDDSGKFVNGIIDSIHKKTGTVAPASGKEGSVHGTDS